MKQLIDFERFDPFRRPDWRYTRVLQMLNRPGNPGRSTRRDDKYIIALRNFVLRYERSLDEYTKNRIGYSNPGLYWAYKIYDCDPTDRETATMIEGRLLAGQSDEEIAAEIDTIPDTIHWYEAVFFNVRDRLTAHDWIVKHVLMTSLHQAESAAEQDTVDNMYIGNQSRQPRKPLSEPHFDATLKFFGYFGGPLILDFVISGFRRGLAATSRDNVAGWLDQQTQNRLRHRSAAAATTFEVNKYNVMELFATHLKIIEIQKSDKTEQAKQSDTASLIDETLRSMKWAVGSGATAIEPASASYRLRVGAAELRDDELMAVEAGVASADKLLETVGQLRLPAPGTTMADK